MSKPKILIVDDSDANRLVLRRLAIELDAEPLEAGDGLEGLSKARGNDLALILMDLQMPTMDGFETTRLLRASPRTAHIPIIMITEVRVSLADQRHGFDLGAVAYLNRQKLDLDALKAQMHTLLDLYRRASDLQARIHAFLQDSGRLAAGNEQIRALQDGLHRHLLLDPLTGLPNRMYFEMQLDIAIKRAARGGRPFAMAYIDLDHLDRLNERHSSEVGDAMLLSVGERIESVIRTSDIFARIHGGTYGLLLSGVSNAEEANLALQKVMGVSGGALEVPGVAGSNTMTLIPTLSVGVAIYPRHGNDRSGLTQVARKAAKEVFTSGGDGVRIGHGKEAA